MMVASSDGSYTAFSESYNEHYHSTKDGALNESLSKHIKPAFLLQSHKSELRVLDLCFGLGYNTLSTLYYADLVGFEGSLYIYSPELDADLIASLEGFRYPEEFRAYLHILSHLIRDGIYASSTRRVELFIGDARKFIEAFEPKSVDIIYQDAFSPKVNPLLWTREYFASLGRILKDDGVLTTYSTAISTRLALYESGFLVQLNRSEGIRNSTVATFVPSGHFEVVDMAHKIRTNPDAVALSDLDLKLDDPRDPN
jgi:tRNA U34 5-methylaminomethyl-2-thiouridine-forming methyltransferase MnmC